MEENKHIVTIMSQIMNSVLFICWLNCFMYYFYLPCFVFFSFMFQYLYQRRIQNPVDVICLKSFWISLSFYIPSGLNILEFLWLTGSPALHKKWSFSLRTSSVNMTKLAASWGFGQFTKEILNLKLPFIVQW